MKLTRKVVESLKLAGLVTSTAPTEAFTYKFNTVEDMMKAGFISDGRAFKFLEDRFNEQGVEKTLVVVSEEIEPEVINSEPIEPEVINSEPIEDDGPEFDGAGFTDADNDPPENVPENVPVEEPVKEEIKEVVEEPAQNPPEDSPVVDPKQKKTTTTKKTSTTKKTTTKKES